MKRKAMIFFLILITNLTLANDKAKLGRDIKAQFQSEAITQKSQAKVDQLDKNTQLLLDEYKRTLQKIENTKIYNSQLEKLIQNQNDEQESLKKQIASIKETNEGVVPFMLEMLTTLDQMVQNDTPFLPKEREKRVQDLKSMMNRADVSTSEKFRRILEAYQVENEYGRTLEAYRGKLSTENKDITVDFLRVGRLALMYQTLDQKEQGMWDKSSKSWIKLNDDYRRSITTGLKVARKQTAPELLTLPIKKETL